MKKLIQTRLYDSMKSKESGNCFPTVIACIMDLNSPDDVIQIQEHYKDDEEEEDHAWIDVLMDWLTEKGYEWYGLTEHLTSEQYYLVTGKTIRGTVHVCIYFKGELYHDPHPSGAGLTEILNYEYIGKL